MKSARAEWADNSSVGRHDRTPVTVVRFARHLRANRKLNLMRATIRMTGGSIGRNLWKSTMSGLYKGVRVKRSTQFSAHYWLWATTPEEAGDETIFVSPPSADLLLFGWLSFKCFSTCKARKTKLKGRTDEMQSKYGSKEPAKDWNITSTTTISTTNLSI